METCTEARDCPLVASVIRPVTTPTGRSELGLDDANTGVADAGEERGRTTSWFATTVNSRVVPSSSVRTASPTETLAQAQLTRLSRGNVVGLYAMATPDVTVSRSRASWRVAFSMLSPATLSSALCALGGSALPPLATIWIPSSSSVAFTPGDATSNASMTSRTLDVLMLTLLRCVHNDIPA